MLIHFETSNYKSLRKTQGLNLQIKYGAPFGVEKKMWDTNISTGIGVFGPNASGKTNMLLAMDCLSNIVQNGGIKSSFKNIQLSPFKLGDVLGEDTAFFCAFLINKHVYEYTLILNERQIVEEKLEIALSNNNEDRYLIFGRRPGLEDKDWRFGIGTPSHLEIPISKREVAKEISSEAVFLSFYSKSFPDENIRKISELIGDLRMIPLFSSQKYQGNHALLDEEFMIDEISEYQKFGSSLSQFLSLFEPSILGLVVKNNEVFVEYNAKGRKYRNEMANESQGIQQMFRFSALILNTLRRGTTLVVDELDAHLHHLICRKIIWIFQNKNINKKGAQLIFTTHNLNLLDNDLFSKEELFLCEKNECLETELFKISEIEGVRQREPFQKKYLAGRYFGLPQIKSDRLIEDDLKACMKVFESHVSERLK